MPACIFHDNGNPGTSAVPDGIVLLFGGMVARVSPRFPTALLSHSCLLYH